MSRRSVSGQFIDGAKGPIFVLAREPAAGVRGCVLVVPPFAEEMNKCRRMVTEVASSACRPRNCDRATRPLRYGRQRR